MYKVNEWVEGEIEKENIYQLSLMYSFFILRGFFICLGIFVY